MGCDCTNQLSKGTSKKDVKEFLEILGYKKFYKDYFYYYDRTSREQITGVSAHILDTVPISVHTKTNIWRSVKDHEIHNFTIKQLRKRFGGNFISDKGINRYLSFDGYKRRKEEAGCDLSYYEFRNNLTTIYGFVTIIEKNEQEYPINEITKMYNPIISSINMGLPFLVSVMEECLRGFYISILRYHQNKGQIFKNSRLSNEELVEVSNGELTIEEVVARSKSFQNVNLINRNFKELNNKLSFIDCLKRYHPRRKYNEKLKSIIQKRHELIHQFVINNDYAIKDFKSDIKTIEIVINTFHDRMIEIYGWNERTL